MKNCKIAICSFLLVLLLVNVGAAADLEQGFMGNKWGENISSFRWFAELYSKKEVTYYSNPSESYHIDDIPINDVTFGFYKDRLFAVHINVDTMETFDRIKMYMKSKYGFSDRKVSSKNSTTTLKWKHKDVIIKIKVDETKGRVKLSFYYGPIASELKKDQPEELLDTSYRFFPIDKNKRPRLVPFLEF